MPHHLKPEEMTMKIAFQGELGAHSHLAIKSRYPLAEAVPCPTFEDAFSAIEDGSCDLGMIPVENSIAGRVADIHHLMPHADLSIIAEHFEPVHHQLLALPGVKLSDIKIARSHPMALGQCRNFLRAKGIRSVVATDTAGSARELKDSQDRNSAAIASRLAAQLYGLETLAADIEDAKHNTTRFLILSKTPEWPKVGTVPCKTTFVFEVRNVPAALFKAMGGFATNGVNMTKLESYMLDGSFTATQFYADVDGHPEDRSLKLALEELNFFSTHVKILGVYPSVEKDQ
jgi:prephenate dehydratase